MADQSRPRSRRAGVLAIGLFGLAMAELATAIAAAIVSSVSWANAVGSPRWRWLIWVAAADGLLFVLSFGGPGTLASGRLVAHPLLTVPFYHRLTALWTASNAAWPVIIGLALASLVIRYRRGGDAMRRQLLACAALFTPLRRRTQRMVDRQFNRTRYDADQAIAAFAARLREGVDLDAVSADLTAVVRTALEPAHLSVWISRHPS